MDVSPHHGAPPDEPHGPVRHVDGNALAGLLADVFAGDMTMALLACGHCGQVGPLAAASVEDDGAAAIVRCRACTRTLLTVLRLDGRLSLRIGGLSRLDLAL
ncbi:DUF6510 family protein [uncultured Microbacterium sp.]|uniref:Uncharacterized protein n=1 Tax=uncultured Microbacterium sp. TaxID=191216 RepID=A0A1Y5P6J7_9MICO|nr:DUF6510 family protein [uncultured Microbacterium sp.]SBS74293.1 hypothetical protein MIPYR_60048 [uncultured Microbacterium sp.]